MIDINTEIEYMQHGQDVYNNAADVVTKINATKMIDSAISRLTLKLIEEVGIEMMLTIVSNRLRKEKI